MAVAALEPETGLWLERARGADFAGAVGLHGAHPGPGGGGVARRRRDYPRMAGACHRDGVGPARGTVTHVPGDPARPFGDDDLEANFVRVTPRS